MITKTANRLTEIDMKLRNLELVSIWGDLESRCQARHEIQELVEEWELLWASEA